MSHLALEVVHLKLELMGLSGTRLVSSAKLITQIPVRLMNVV